MNVRKVIRDFSLPVARHIEVNNDSVMTVATDSGFRAYDLNDGNMLTLNKLHGSISVAAVVNDTGVFGLISGGSSPKWPIEEFVIWDDEQKKSVAKIYTSLPAKRACMTESHVALVYDEGLLIYRIDLAAKELITFESRLGKYPSASNPNSLCCLGDRYAIFPGRTAGQVNVLKLANRTNTIIPAHTTQLSALAVSRDESMIATASIQGTLIRVFSTKDSARLFEFRRGLDRAIIFSLSFSPSGHQLAVTSDKSTLHVFDLAPMDPPATKVETSASHVSHSRTSSSSSKPVTIPRRPSVASAKRASFGAVSTSPDPFSGFGTSPGSKQRRYVEADKYSIAPSDSASQAGAPSSTTGAQGRPSQPAWNDMMRQQPQGRALSIMSEATDATAKGSATTSGGSTRGKYGNLANLPFAPKILSDTYSTLSCSFEIGDEGGADLTPGAATSALTSGLAALGLGTSSSSANQGQASSTGTAKVAKGRIGWLNDHELVVVGAGRDARWEKFRIGIDGSGKRGIEWVCWKRYMDWDGFGGQD